MVRNGVKTDSLHLHLQSLKNFDPLFLLVKTDNIQNQNLLQIRYQYIFFNQIWYIF